MPAVQAVSPDIKEKLKKKLDKALDGPPGDPTKSVTIKSWTGKEVTVTDGFCLVILSKKAAKSNGLVTCNNDWDLCIWDPVTGQVRCTDSPE